MKNYSTFYLSKPELSVTEVTSCCESLQARSDVPFTMGNRSCRTLVAPDFGVRRARYNLSKVDVARLHPFRATLIHNLCPLLMSKKPEPTPSACCIAEAKFFSFPTFGT